MPMHPIVANLRTCSLPLVLACLAGPAACAALAADAGPPDDGLRQDGAKLYGEFCEQCHGADRRGLEVFEGDVAALTARLTVMTERMPDFTGFFDQDQLAALQAYLAAPK